MRAIVITLGVLLAASATPAAAAEPPLVPALSAKVADCRTGLDIDERVAAFTGAMPAADGASQLAMRFTLEQRRGSPWKALAIPGFTRWERAEHDASGFVYDKRVERLAAGASYRVTVRFRWSRADGTVVKRATRSSGSCRQPELRPDPVVAGAP